MSCTGLIAQRGVHANVLRMVDTIPVMTMAQLEIDM